MRERRLSPTKNAAIADARATFVAKGGREQAPDRRAHCPLREMSDALFFGPAEGVRLEGK